MDFGQDQRGFRRAGTQAGALSAARVHHGQATSARGRWAPGPECRGGALRLAPHDLARPCFVGALEGLL
eukprot:14521297-Alexandrium_andersonii.AAC.1